MELITVRDLTIELEGRRLLADGELALRSGMRLGVVGANGSGKSVLLEVLAGRREPAAGSVRRAPGLELGYLPQQRGLTDSRTSWEFALRGLQRVRELEEQLRREERLLARNEGDLERYGELVELFERMEGYGAEGRLREYLSAVGIEGRLLESPVRELSGGEQSRLLLARILASRADVLLLDEPSNGLDLAGLRWLGERLSEWRGGLVLVSHDRALLDEVTTHTAGLEGGRLRLERGNYSRYRERQGNRLLRSERERRERSKRVERLERTAQELRRWGNRAAQRRRRRLEREMEATRPEPSEEPSSPARAVPQATPAPGTLLLARRLASDRGGTALRVPEVRIDRGDKIALLGANGSGKSTLLALLSGDLESSDPKAELWRHSDSKLFQAGQSDRGLRGDDPPLVQLERLVHGQRARMLLSLCGIDRDRWATPPESLSPGERGRVGLALLLSSEANLLLLDEPDNDLDLPAIELLEHALAETEAAVVVATHDRALARMATRVWSLEAGELIEYRGGLDGYLHGRRRMEPQLDAVAAHWDAGDPLGEATASDQSQGRLDDLEEAQGRLDALDEGQGRLDDLELERLGLEERLGDPLLLGERERQRLEQRLSLVLDELSLQYDRALPPPPLPAFTVREGGIRVWADLIAGEPELATSAPVRIRVEGTGGVCHLVIREEEGSCLLPWAWSAVADAATRLLFYLVAPAAVQHYSRRALDCRILQPRGQGWWAIGRREFEALERWLGPGPAAAVGERLRA